MLKTLPVKSLLFIFCILSSTWASLVPALKYHCFFTVPEGEEHLSLGTGIRRWGQTTKKSFSVLLHIGSMSLGSLHHSTWAAAALPPESWCLEQCLCCGEYMKQARSPFSGLCRWNKNKIYVKRKKRGGGISWGQGIVGQHLGWASQGGFVSSGSHSAGMGALRVTRGFSGKAQGSGLKTSTHLPV